MTRPDPDPDDTAALDAGRSVQPGDTPPAESSTSQSSSGPDLGPQIPHNREHRARGKTYLFTIVGLLVLIAIVALVILV